MQSQARERAQKIRLMAFDVDGVLTDGRLYYTDAGEEIKAFHSRDGHGIKMLARTGITIAIITGRRSSCVEARAANLGIDLVFQGVEDKAVALAELMQRLDLDTSEVGYMGDDVVDLPVLARCGFAATVPEAHPMVLDHAHYVARQAAGLGAARDVCEFILDAQGKLESSLARFLPA